MFFLLFAVSAAVAMFLASLFLLEWGRHAGARIMAQQSASATSGMNAVEGAVFALMGLLLAFSLNGSLQRFDERRTLILQEANAISTSYDRLDLLTGEAKDKLKAKLKDYLRARLELYRMPIEFSFVHSKAEFNPEQQARIAAFKNEVWQGAVAACPDPANSSSACVLILQSLNSAFEAARLRAGANERHPPTIIYVMLFGLGLAASTLAGFGMAASKSRSWLHMMTFAGALSVTLYVITDIEFPRLGLITVEYYDGFLYQVLAQMQ